MNLTGGIVLFASLWFLTLFCVMPIGQRSQADAGDVIRGTHAGAPAGVNWRRKLLWTTLVSAVLFGIGMAAFSAGYLNVERLNNLMGVPL